MKTSQLRDRLTPFGEQLAAAIEQPATVRWSVLSPAATVAPMRRLLARLGLETAQAIRQGDGSMRPTWHEAPELWISRWVNSETAIVMMEDDTGPLELRFLMRTALDTVRTRYRIGRGPLVTGLAAALWDVGIRRIDAEVEATASPQWLAETRARGFTITDRGDGWLDMVYVMREREDILGDAARRRE